MTDLARRRFIAGAGLIAGSAALPAHAQPSAEPALRLRLVYGLPRVLDLPYRAVENAAADIAQASEGSIRITIDTPRPAPATSPAEDDAGEPAASETQPRAEDDRTQPGPHIGEDLIEAVRTERIDMAYVKLDDHAAREPALAFAGGAPFGLNARQHLAWWHEGGGGDLIDAALARHGCIALPCGAGGMPMGGFYPRDMREASDFEGLRLGASGFGVQVLERLGAVIIDTAPEDLGSALRDGEIDAAAFLGPVDDELLDLHRYNRFYHAPGFWQGTVNYALVINRRLWEDLSPARRMLITLAAQAAHQRLLAAYDHRTAPALRRLAIAGVEMRYFPQAVMQAGLAAAQSVYDDAARRDTLFAEAYRSMQDFRRDALLSWPVAELSFDTFMARSRGEP